MGKTDYEGILASQLEEKGIRFTSQFRYAPPRLWRADFLLDDYDLLIEVQGISFKGQAYRHQTGTHYQQDCLKHNEALLRGYQMLIFTTQMVTGNAIDNIKGRPKMERAIDTIIRYIDMKRA